MMRRSLTCPKCFATQLWHVRSVRGAGGDLAVTWSRKRGFFSLPEPYGRLELLACGRCGHAQWYARALEIDAAAHAIARTLPRPCDGCDGQRGWHVPTMCEPDGGVPVDMRVLGASFPRYWQEGYFESFVCRGCGKTEWFAYGIDSFTPSAGLTLAQDACGRCGGEARWRVAPSSAIGPSGWVGRAHLGASICRGCRHVEWSVPDLSRLRHRPEQGIVLVEASAKAAGGPYR